jgi:hypothetical protein
MSFPNEVTGTTALPGKGVGEGVNVGASRVAVGVKVGEFVGVAVRVGGISVAVEVGVNVWVAVAAVAEAASVGTGSMPTSKVRLQEAVKRVMTTRLTTIRMIIMPPYHS